MRTTLLGYTREWFGAHMLEGDVDGRRVRVRVDGDSLDREEAAGTLEEFVSQALALAYLTGHEVTP